MLSLDLEKSFDKVNLEVATTILNGLKLPHHLINRIIKACVGKDFFNLVSSAHPRTVSKSQGVKQGCPSSPRLFTLVIDAVLQTLSEELNISFRQSGAAFTYAILLAYADDIDIIFITRDISILGTS